MIRYFKNDGVWTFILPIFACTMDFKCFQFF